MHYTRVYYWVSSWWANRIGLASLSQSTQETSTGIHHCGDTPTTMPQDTSLKTCSQQVISYYFTTRHRLPHCITDQDLNLVSADIVNKTQYTVLEDIGSDHGPTLIQLIYRTIQRQLRWRWNYKKANWVKFREISDKHLQSLQFGKDCNKNYRKVCVAIKDAAKQSIPQGHRYKYKPYWTEEIAELVTQFNQARKKVERDPTKGNRQGFSQDSETARPK